MIVTVSKEDLAAAEFAVEVIQWYQDDDQWYSGGPAKTWDNAIAAAGQCDDRPMAELRTLYAHGKQILEHYKIVSSERSVVAGDRIYEQVERQGAVLIVRQYAGHIATSEAYRYVGLVPR